MDPEGRLSYLSSSYLGSHRDIGDVCSAAKELIPNYDVGIAILNGAMGLAFVMGHCGLPILNVKMQRIDNKYDATWKPLDELTNETLEGKRIIVLENDVLTGKTLTRAYQELSKFNPSSIDLFLARYKTLVDKSNYKGNEQYFPNLHFSGYQTEQWVDTRGNVPDSYGKTLGLPDFESDPNVVLEFIKKVESSGFIL